MSEDSEVADADVDQARLTFDVVRLRGTITAPYSTRSIEDIVAIQIAKRIQIPLAETTAVTCFALCVSAVLVGVVILIVPFAIAFVYSIYAIYTLRISTEENKPVSDYVVLSESGPESAIPSTSTSTLTEATVDSNDEEQSDNPEDT